MSIVFILGEGGRERGERGREGEEGGGRERERERDSASCPFLVNKHSTVHTKCLLTWRLGKK